MNQLVKGAGGGGGGKGGGGTARAAVEAPDSLRSKQFARVLDLVSEGEIEGLVDGLKSIYLNDTPLQNADNSFNFQDVVVGYRYGTQDQAYLPGFPAAENEVIVSTQVTAATPVVRTVSSSNVNAARVTLLFPQLTHQNTTNGDLKGTSVNIAIDVQTAGGGYVNQLSDSITGKTTTQYQRSYYVALSGSGPWDIRVRRLTDDSASAALVNPTFWSSYTEIIDQKLKYPNCALVGISIDAAQFDQIPTRGYDVKLLKVLVPSNYFPLTRTYTRNKTTGLDTGIPQTWDGTFYVAWTDNPAWCWYDLVTNERYGLGEYVDVSLVDKWALYTIGKYCDEIVPDGFGGSEPRFTCNLYMQTREEAYRVVNALASIFRGLAFWAGGGMTATHDAPADPIALFTAANVINGEFQYTGSSKKARHTVALVTWNDPSKAFRQEIEYVEDQAGIARYGVVQTEVVAVGCTSRGQAHRIGRWLLYTERLETEVVVFRTGLEGAHLYPGAVITTQDPSRSGKRNGGRIVSATTSAVTIDAPILIEVSKTYTLSVVLPDGSIEDRVLNNSPASTSVLTFTTPLTAAPQVMGMWVVSVSDLSTEMWRVVGLTETSNHELEVSAIEHHPEKYALVELDVAFEPAQTIDLDTVSYPPSGLSASTYLNTLGGLDVIISWSAAEGTKSTTVMWRKDSDNFVSEVIYGQTYTIRNASIGTYTILVSTTNSLGAQSIAADLTYNVVSAVILPDVTGLALKQPFVDQFASFTWDVLPTADSYRVQVVVSGVVKRDVFVTDSWFNYNYADSIADGAGTPFRAFDLRVKAVYGTLESGNWETITASNSAPAAPAATVTAITGGVQVSAPLPADSDYAGMQVWASTTSGFTPGAGNLVYDGVNNSANILNMFGGAPIASGVPLYVRVAFYDVFGKTGLNLTSQYSVTPLSNSADLPVVASLPGSATEGQVVYLTTDDKLYRYNGTAWVTWVDGSDILASSVTAAKISVSSLSALSANMGTLTSGNITVDGSGFIRGGSTGYLTGSGFWMGYHSGAYKFHIGDPTGDRIAWTGSSLDIKGTLNAVTGTFGALTVASGGSIRMGQTAYNVGTGFWLGDAGGVAKFSIGSPAGNNMRWDGTALTISGQVDDLRPYAAGSTPIAASPALVHFTTYISAMTLVKEIVVVRGGTLTVEFDMIWESSTRGQAQIYKNGVAVGTLRSPTATFGSWITFSENISGLVAGDKIQVYMRVEATFSQAKVKNMWLKNAFRIAEITTL